ncbi:MAG: hypothetical protein HY360_03490 [Verrucomicrobia bacterium]|nr:hypothetical protein [Verrucomicrobiota bacterium]
MNQITPCGSMYWRARLPDFSMDDITYYISTGGAVRGPYPLRDIFEWRLAGDLDAEAFIWTGQDWQSLDEFLDTLPADALAPHTKPDETENAGQDGNHAKADEADQATLERLERTQRNILNACLAGFISGAFSLALALLAFRAGVAGLDSQKLLEALLIFGLTLGACRKNRVCMMALLCLFIARQIPVWLESARLTTAPLALVFGYYYLRGVLATMEYHQLTRTRPV